MLTLVIFRERRIDFDRSPIPNFWYLPKFSVVGQWVRVVGKFIVGQWVGVSFWKACTLDSLDNLQWVLVPEQNMHLLINQLNSLQTKFTTI